MKFFLFLGKKGFDRESKSVYTFLVFASDGVRTGSATVKVTITDVNDETPEFTDGPYIRYVQENQKPGAVVGYVTAKDRDEGSNAFITYELVNDRFTIDPNTGLIRTKKMLNREIEDNEFTVTVTATNLKSDTKLQGRVQVIIRVTDANDEYPYFTQAKFTTKMAECADIGERVTQVRAKDNDEGINAELVYAIASGNTPRRFRIDPDTGVITVAHELDFEKEKGYKLVINVRDKGLPQLISKKNASVTVTMEDCNDHSPRFAESSYTISVKEDEPIGYQILLVTAKDDDTGPNKLFDFFIVDQEENYQFKMEESSPGIGAIVLDWKLDREKRSKHIFKIGARDRGKVPMTGYAQVTVNVLDVNDNGPEFVMSDTCGKVMEEETGVQTVATVKVVDKDDKGNQCPCVFQIIDDRSNLFVIERQASGDSAVIKTRAGVKFDRDVKDKQLYKIKVSATDDGTPKQFSETYVYVEVMDKNDNTPSNGGEMSVTLNAFQGKFQGGGIGKVYIIDNDRGTNDKYSHTIETGGSKYFTIDSNGMIIAKRDVPGGEYELAIKSKDMNGPPSGTVKSNVKIDVRSITEAAVKNSIPIRMSGVTKDLTCNEMKYPDFEKLIGEILGVDPSQVLIFSTMEVPNLDRGVDIWFSVVKKKGVDSITVGDGQFMSMMEMLIALNEKKTLIEKKTGAFHLIVFFSLK